MEKSIKEKIEQDVVIAKEIILNDSTYLSFEDTISVAKLVGEERRFQETQQNAQKQIDNILKQQAKMFDLDDKEIKDIKNNYDLKKLL